MFYTASRQSFTVIEDGSNTHHWRYGVEYTERLSHWPYWLNKSTAFVSVKHIVKDRKSPEEFVVESVHQTCFLGGFYCCKYYILLLPIISSSYISNLPTRDSEFGWDLHVPCQRTAYIVPRVYHVPVSPIYAELLSHRGRVPAQRDNEESGCSFRIKRSTIQILYLHIKQSSNMTFSNKRNSLNICNA